MQTLSSDTGRHLADLTRLHGDGRALELIDSDQIGDVPADPELRWGVAALPRHFGASEDHLRRRDGREMGVPFASETDPSVWRVLLKVKPGMGEGYGLGRVRRLRRRLAVSHYAESVG